MPSPAQSLFTGLPYDIRHLIYQQLFPQTSEVYLQAYKRTLLVNIPERALCLNILRVNRQLNSEAGEFFYGNYLFTIYGTKKDCLATYQDFSQTLAKYVHMEPRVDVLSNGAHSSTAGISIQAGDRKLAILRRRRRGQLQTVRQLELECLQSTKRDPWMLVAPLVALLAWIIVFFFS